MLSSGETLLVDVGLDTAEIFAWLGLSLCVPEEEGLCNCSLYLHVPSAWIRTSRTCSTSWVALGEKGLHIA